MKPKLGEQPVRLGIRVSGTVGILEKAAERDLLELAKAFQKLAGTNFRVDPELLRNALGRDAARREVTP